MQQQIHINWLVLSIPSFSLSCHLCEWMFHLLSLDNWKNFFSSLCRSVLQSDSQGSGRCPHCNKFPSDPDSSNNNGDGSAPDDPLNLSDIANRLQQKFRDYVNPMDWYEEARPHLTLGNIVHVFKFILILGMALISGK